jgi:predicted amidophosphoribosyltransferase
MSKASSASIPAHVATPPNKRTCRNCDAPAPGNYCPACGQETSLHPPSVGEFIHEFIGHYVAIESTLVQTLWALVAKPGKLTVDYLAGRKRRFT